MRVGQKGSEGAGLKDWSYAATSQVMPEPSEAGRSKEWIVTHWKLTHTWKMKPEPIVARGVVDTYSFQKQYWLKSQDSKYKVSFETTPKGCGMESYALYLLCSL